MPTRLKKPSTSAQRNINSFYCTLVVVCSGLEYQDHSPLMGICYYRACYSLYVAGDFEVLFLLYECWWEYKSFPRKTTVMNSVLTSLLMIRCLLCKKVNTETGKLYLAHEDTNLDWLLTIFKSWTVASCLCSKRLVKCQLMTFQISSLCSKLKSSCRINSTCVQKKSTIKALTFYLNVERKSQGFFFFTANNRLICLSLLCSVISYRGVVRVDISLQDVDIDQCSADGWFAGTHRCNLTTMEVSPSSSSCFSDTIQKI